MDHYSQWAHSDQECVNRRHAAKQALNEEWVKKPVEAALWQIGESLRSWREVDRVDTMDFLSDAWQSKFVRLPGLRDDED